MNKRISKKLHKKYLNDGIYDVSLSPLWRKKLFDSNYGEKFIISFYNINEIPKYIKQPISKYRLKYFVYKTEEMLNQDFYYEGGVFFMFEAMKFKDISNYSFNNVKVI